MHPKAFITYPISFPKTLKNASAMKLRKEKIIFVFLFLILCFYASVRRITTMKQKRVGNQVSKVHLRN
ncbi:hypothetical protein BSU00_01440 [Tenacibaculum sp. SG-28]|nr:hypothetical protein BSU00_01440 [Tenacibaculum sp. SG-28]